MSSAVPRDCWRARELMAGQPTDPAQALWVEQHQKCCPACRQAEEDLAWLRRGVEETPDELDDMARARVLLRLGPVLDQATRPASRPMRRGVLAAVVVTSLAIWTPVAIWLLRPSSPAGNAAERAPSPAAALLPFAVERGAMRWGQLQAVLGRRVPELVLPQGVRVRAAVGRRTTLTLAGPGQLSATPPDKLGSSSTLSLKRGRLIVHFAGCPACWLRVRLPGAVVEVVGTVFMAEVRDGHVRVSVSRGVVRIRSSVETSLVRTGESWSPDSPLRLLNDDEKGALREFDDNSRDNVIAEPTQVGLRPAPDEPSQAESPAEPAPVRTQNEPRPAPPPAKAPASAPASQPAAKPVAVAPPASKPAAKPAKKLAAPVKRVAAVAPPSSDAAALYRRAEEAMRSRNTAATRQLLEQLVRRWANDPLAAQARYELAHLLLRAGQLDEAQRHLDALAGMGHRRDAAASGPMAMAEPAGYLRCRLLQQRRADAQARACYRSFRQQYPRSPHDEAVLGALLTLAADCVDAKLYATEYLTRHAKGRLTGEARRQLHRCGATGSGAGAPEGGK